DQRHPVRSRGDPRLGADPEGHRPFRDRVGGEGQPHPRGAYPARARLGAALRLARRLGAGGGRRSGRPSGRRRRDGFRRRRFGGVRRVGRRGGGREAPGVDRFAHGRRGVPRAGAGRGAVRDRGLQGGAGADLAADRGDEDLQPGPRAARRHRVPHPGGGGHAGGIRRTLDDRGI
ncbi:MAG: Biotin carboxyl carrier protein of acetyl-CoA carboxylase, partial [uncultured Acetobacteraceae bacterium]